MFHASCLLGRYEVVCMKTGKEELSNDESKTVNPDRGNEVIVRKETFAIVKSKNPSSRAFANIIDGNEITVVIDQSLIKDEDVIEIDEGWRMLTFDMVLPLNLVGFLAKISQAFADEGIPIFVISAYSTDHVLVKQRDLRRAIETLTGLGFEVSCE